MNLAFVPGVVVALFFEVIVAFVLEVVAQPPSAVAFDFYGCTYSLHSHGYSSGYLHRPASIGFVRM